MFCSQCGKEVPEGAAFCAGCGTPVGAAPAAPAAPVATAEAKPSAVMKVLNSFLAILKGVFSGDVVKTVGAQAKNTGFEWIVGIALTVLTFTVAMSVNFLQGVSQLVKGIAGGMGSQLMEYIGFPFLGIFGVSLLIGLITTGAVVAGMWLLAKLVAKKNVSWFSVLNLVATATLPLSACYIVNMLLGLIWLPLPIIVSVVALMMTVVLLYIGFQKLEKPVLAPFYPFTALIAAVTIVALLLSYLLYGSVLSVWIKGLSGGLMGGLLG